MSLIALGGCDTESSKPFDGSSDSQLYLYNTTARLEFERGETNYAAVSYSKALNRARAMDDGAGITAAAYDLAICRAALGDYDGAAIVLDEAEREARRAGVSTANILIVEARLALLKHDDAAARRISTAVLTRKDANPTSEQRLAAHVLIGLAAIQQSDVPSAREQLSQAKVLSNKASDLISQAAVAGLAGEIHFLSGEFSAAAGDFDRQAQLSQQAHDYRTMIRALVKAGRSASRAGNQMQSADRLYRAARAAIAARNADADAILTEARAVAATAGDETLVRLIESLKSPTSQPAAP